MSKVSRTEPTLRKDESLLMIYSGGQKEISFVFSKEVFLDEQAEILGETIIKAWKKLQEQPK